MEKNKTSLWLSITILLVASTMMHPGIASLIAMPIIAVLIFVMRAVAHTEGFNKH